MLHFPLYKMNIATREVDYNTKWVISVAELDEINPAPSDPLTYSWTTDEGEKTSQGGHWYASPEYVKKAFPEVGTMFLPKVDNYNSTLSMYYGAWSYRRTQYINSGPVNFKYGMPVVYQTYSDFLAKRNATTEEMTKDYNPYTLKSIFGTKLLISEGYKDGKSTSWLNGIPTKFLSEGYAWYNPANGRYMTNTNTERKVYDRDGRLLEQNNIYLGSSYDATFMAVKKGTLENGRITKNTYIGYPQFRVYEGVYYNYPKADTILPWDSSKMFIYNVRSDEYTAYFYKDAIVSYPREWKRLGDISYSHKYFRLLEESSPTPSIYWNGDGSENPIVNVGGKNYVHSDAYVWGGAYGSAVETIYGSYDFENEQEVLTKFSSWDEYYASDAYAKAEAIYEEHYEYCYDENMNFVGYKGFVIEAPSGIPGFRENFNEETGDWDMVPTHFKPGQGTPTWEHWWRRNPVEPFPTL